ncbi:hypothetical protein CXB51_025861 [Gossypium anomalum]|uniref:Chalcone synthase n=1 Tax=Gossypium anomalum TaxID=47600 RepID=A0A8J5YRH9_9ROSI|nr:hypothetical protein CXB51_025861 [Gossypium anomalum]
MWRIGWRGRRVEARIRWMPQSHVPPVLTLARGLGSAQPRDSQLPSPSSCILFIGQNSGLSTPPFHSRLSSTPHSPPLTVFDHPKRMVTVEEVRKAQRAQGPATVLAIGTSTPPNCVDQSTYPDYYFRITNSEHKTELKEKFKRMCEKSMIKKRYMYLTEEILKENPNVCEYMAPSLDARQDMVVVEVPKLGKEAATKAIKEWGQPNGVDMPGADYQLTKLLGLRPSVKRLMMYQQGCFAGGTVLRVAKDLAENNKGARVLVVCSEITAVTFRGPSDTHLDSLVAKHCLVMVPQLWAYISPSKDVPGLISKNIEKSLVEAFLPLGISDWNSLFWIAHPGGPAILDQVEAKLALKPEKLRATRHVLSEYGEGLEWGVLFGFGPGLTVETVVLHSVAA